MQDSLVDELRRENPITGQIPKGWAEQNQSALQDIANEWREASTTFCNRKDKQDLLRARFNSVMKWENPERTEEFWAILTPCVSENAEDRGTMAEVVERLVKFRPDLKQTA
jgi:hypothetical protein